MRVCELLSALCPRLRPLPKPCSGRNEASSGRAGDVPRALVPSRLSGLVPVSFHRASAVPKAARQSFAGPNRSAPHGSLGGRLDLRGGRKPARPAHVCVQAPTHPQEQRERPSERGESSACRALPRRGREGVGVDRALSFLVLLCVGRTVSPGHVAPRFFLPFPPRWVLMFVCGGGRVLAKVRFCCGGK